MTTPPDQILVLVPVPTRPGVWRRWWCTETTWVSRVMVVSGSSALDLRTGRRRRLEWFATQAGGWQWVQATGPRASLEAGL